MDLLRTLRAPTAVAGSYLASIKLTKLMAGDLPYEANIFWKALAHILPVRNSDILANPTPWVYSREYLGCLGRDTMLCLLPTSSNAWEQLVVVTEDMLPELPTTATTFSLWQAASFLVTKSSKVVDTEWATYAILDTVAQDLASGSRGRLSPTATSVWNRLEEDLEAFLEGEDTYFDAIEETAAPVAAAFRSATSGDDEWEDDASGNEVRGQIQDLSTMLQHIGIKHRRELEHVMRVSSDQTKKLIRRNSKLKRAVKDAEDDARDVINHNHNELLDAQEKVTELEGTQETLITEKEGLEDQVKELRDQAEQKSHTEEENERLVKEIENLHKNLATVRGDLAGSEAKVTGLESQAKALNENVAEAQEARNIAIDAKLALDTEYKLLNECCDDAEKARNEAEERIIEERKGHEEAYSSLQADHSKLATDYKALEANYDSAAKSADDAIEELVNVKDTVRALEDEVERLEAEKASSEKARKDSLNDIEKELSEAKRTISNLRDEIGKTEADNAESEQILQERIDELQAEVIRAEVGAHDKALALEEEINDLKDEVMRWQETREAHAAEVEASETAKNAAFEDKTQLTAENDKLKHQVKELQANYNGEKYNKLDKERRSLQAKLAEQKQATLIAQGNVRRLEREVAALQKRLQAQAVPAPETIAYNEEEDRDNDDGQDGHGRPDGGQGKKSVGNDDGSPEGSAERLPAGSNNHEAAGNIGSSPSHPSDFQPSGSTFNRPTNQDGTTDVDSTPTDPPAATTVSEFDPFAGDFAPSHSPPHKPHTRANTPFNGQPTRHGVLSSPEKISATSTSPNPKESTADPVPSQWNNASTSTPASTKSSLLSGSATTFFPKSAYNTATSSLQPNTNFENYINKHIGKASDREDSAGPVSEEELGNRQEELAEKIARGDIKAQAARKARRAVVEARLTGDGFFPGANTPKTENELVSESLLDVLETLPSQSLEQSMWAPRGAQNAQQAVESQGQRRPPARPTASAKPMPKVNPPTATTTPAHVRTPAQANIATDNEPNGPPASLGDRPFLAGHPRIPRNQGPPRNDWPATGVAGGSARMGYGQQRDQPERGNFNVQDRQQGYGNYNNGQGARGGTQEHQAPPDAPKKPAAMLSKNRKNKKGHLNLPPHLRGNGPGTPPSGGSQTMS
ncbi:hypothetical protein N7G274_006803 [Stereocaulon virgatum]|uniref:Uncharacterized protein n=1 Tax=Stereocaulon virgatum TaxID=373712 RepID=A0ABR4A4L4_9LECA